MFLPKFVAAAVGSGLESRRVAIGRSTAAVLFVGAGLGHFVAPEFYAQIVPPSFPSPKLLVLVSGICEMAGGVGLMVPILRRAAGWGLMALLVAVFPANIFMALHAERFHFAPWLLWARLPFQFVFMAWIWWVAIRRPAAARAD